PILLLLLAAACTCHQPSSDLVEIPGGTFTAGSTHLATNDNPERSATVGPFLIERHEVTNKEYRVCMNDGACTAPQDAPSVFTAPEQPVVMVTWRQAAAYCAWRDRRLPTEAEWEFAARGEKNYLYPWGDAFEPAAANGGHALACSRSGIIYRYTSPRGCFPQDQSPFGVLDMAGNAAEWTADLYSPDPSLTVAPGTPGVRVVKGGYFYGEPDQLSGAWREPAAEETASPRIGFRCVQDK
ncbi:MAG: formylglycine-generating enzyme family protein, partial [Alphaproteobacteria bacterium]